MAYSFEIPASFRRYAPAMAALCLSTLAGQPMALAQEYPTKPVDLIITFPAGGSTDVIGRVMADRMGGILGQQFVVQNVEGASGAVGFDQLSRAPADGYTLGVAPTAFASLPFVNASFTLNPSEDFTDICLFGEGPTVALVNKDFPAKTLEEFLEYVRANPGSVNYSAHGGDSDLNVGLLVDMADLDMVPVKYRGGAPAIQAMMSNDIQLILLSMLSAQPYIESGDLVPIAIASDKTHPSLPGVPTIDTQVPGYKASSVWFGLIGPAGVPEPIVQELADACATAVADPEVQAQLEKLGIVPSGGGPAEMGAIIDSNIEGFERAAEATGIEPQ